MTEIKLTKRYPNSRIEDITDAYMRGWNDALDAVQNGKFHIAEQTEPSTEVETMSCAECKHRPIGAEICEEACHYESQTDWHYDEQDATWYPYKHEYEPKTEPSTDCGWK